MTMEAIAWLIESVNASGCPCFPPCHGIDYDVFLTTLANPFKDRLDGAFEIIFEVCISCITNILNSLFLIHIVSFVFPHHSAFSVHEYVTLLTRFGEEGE